MKVQNKQPKGLEPGIYFNLHSDAYHDDPALGHSGMVKLLISPLDYWVTGPLNLERPKWEKPKIGSARWFGTMKHAFLLERDKFWLKFKVIGMTARDHKAFDWISVENWKIIKRAVDEIRDVPEAAEYFQNGYPEVSIFWKCRDTGVMLKIRVDWLRIFGGIDYKQARSLLNNQLGWQIGDFGYDMQEQHYIDGIKEAKLQLRQGKFKVVGEHDPEWLKAFMNNAEVSFVFFFQRSEPPYIFRIVFFDRDVQSNARARVDEAKNIYKNYITKYGINRWPAGKAEPEEFNVYHLPKRTIDN